MKCQYCNGTGEHINDANRMTTCEFCGGTGEYEPCDADVELDKLYPTEQTNEQWFCSLSTEEKAKVFIEICRDAFIAEDYRRKHWSDLQTIEYWERWLKERHHE